MGIFDNQNNGQGSDLFSSVINQGNNQKVASNPTPNLSQLASSPYGNLEISRYLYETGLQNIFNDYQQNIELLSKQEQKGIKDAYVVKEMSKKYLGEYASNVGVGDVSGNLIDIYGNYQKNIQEINENFGTLELGLQRQYQQQRQEIMGQIMQNQYNIEVAKLDEIANEILFNVTSGQTDGIDPFTYLAQRKEELGPAQYRAIYGSLYKQTLEEIGANLENGFYGYKTDENGERVRETNANAYLEQYRGILSPSHFSMLEGAIKNPLAGEILSNINKGEFGDAENAFEYLEKFRDRLTPEEYRTLEDGIYTNLVDEIQGRLDTDYYGFTGDGDARVPITDPMAFIEKYRGILSDRDFNRFMEQAEYKNYDKKIQDMLNQAPNVITNMEEFNPDGTKNPYFNRNYNPSYLMKEDASSLAIYIEGKEYVQAAKPVDLDTKGRELNPELEDIFGTDITTDFLKNNQGVLLKDGDIWDYQGYTFRRNNGNWYRLISNPNQNISELFTQDVMKTWEHGKAQTLGTYKNNGNKSDTFVYNGITYTENRNDPRAFDRVASRGNRTEEQQAVVNLFKQIHGDSTGAIKKNTVVFYNGEFWVYNDRNQFRPMSRG